MRAGTVARSLAAGALAISCRGAESPKAGACVADSVREVRLQSSLPHCEADDVACRGQCLLGQAPACLALAYTLDKSSESAEDPKGREARDLYRKACGLGLANACTNHAASIWSGRHSDEEFACAQRTFEKSCAAKEHFACGMVGRLLLEDTDPPAVEDARRRLQASCDALGGFSCRVLAKHYEAGTFGAYPPELVPKLLAQACRGGDPDGCGNPTTAAGTFR